MVKMGYNLLQFFCSRRKDVIKIAFYFPDLNNIRKKKKFIFPSPYMTSSVQASISSRII